jgi:hypothetical protein
VAALALAGCGGSKDDVASESTAAASEPAPARTETVDAPASLPASWTREVNRRGGFSFGVPRGWKAERRGPVSLVRSFDRLVAISIAADRSAGGLELAPGSYARRAAAALRGYRGAPEVGRPRGFAHPRYDASQVRGEATARGGVDQRIAAVVLRRRGLATFTAVIAANAKRVSGADRRLAAQLVRSLRGRPARGQRSGRSG